MLEAAKARTKTTKLMLKVDTLKGLIDRKVGTHSIEKAPKLVTDDSERNESVVVKLMNIALEGAQKKFLKQRKLSNYRLRQAMLNLPE